jgi:hypothetical protein
MQQSPKDDEQVSVREKMITNGKDLLIISLAKFFSKKKHVDTLIEHIDSSKAAATTDDTVAPKTVSLRIIDWFVTNYAKKHSTIIECVDGRGVSKYVNVHASYRSQLKAYSKHQFDPFRRRFRINFFYNRNEHVETTVGQMNFFRWVIEHDILSYINQNIRDIERDMVAALQEKQVVAALQQQEKQVVSVTAAKKKEGPKEPKRAGSPSKKCNVNLIKHSGARLIDFY